LSVAVTHSRAEPLLPAGAGMAAATTAVAAPLAWLFWLSGAVPFALGLAAMAVFVFVVWSAGLLLLRAARAGDMPAPAAWVLGLFATAIAMYALVAAFQVLAATAFAVWAAAVLGLNILLRKHVPAARRMHRTELLGLLLCAAATAMWSYQIAEVPQVLSRDGWLATWTDQFVHGAKISQFGDPLAAGRQGIELADFPAPLYHYASYMLPAAFAWPLDLPGLTLATSLWVPLGFFTLCAAVYVLGRALAGPAGGVAALAALTLVPDAASYGMHNRMFGYYWHVLAVPGASYGIAVILLSIAFLHRWSKTRELGPLLAAACLLLGSLLIRVHLFAIAFPALVACAALSTPFVRRRKLVFVAVAMAALALFVAGFYWVFPDAERALEPFLYVAHVHNQPLPYRGLYLGLYALYGAGIALLVGVLLIVPSVLGVFTVLYPVSVLLAHRSRGLRSIDLVPPALIVFFFLLMFTAPVPAHGDPTEFTQRPFVLVYAVVVIWTAAGFVTWLATLGGLHERRVWLPLVVAAAASVMLILHYTVRDWRWASTHPLAEGLPQAAVFLRANGRPGDLLAVQGLEPRLVTADLAVQLVSLTGMPAYLARPFIQKSGGGLRKEVATQRYTALEGVAGAESAAVAVARLRALGIGWYVVADHQGPRWDPERRQAAFVQGKVAVYAAHPSRP
jgi:hypothetical protein